jgi:hypothetical protein
MLNTNTLDVLKTITPITNSAIISYPVTTITNSSRDILANIDFSKIDDESWEEFGIMDLSSFLNSISILDDNPTIEQDNVFIKAYDENSTIQFVTSYPSTLEDFTTNPEIIESTSRAESILEVQIDTNLFSKIKKGSSTFKNLRDLFIIKEGDKVYLKTGNKETFTSTSNSYTHYLNPCLDKGKDFELIVPVDNFLNLPLMDFTMKIKHNPKTEEFRLLFENEIFKFLFTLK